MMDSMIMRLREPQFVRKVHTLIFHVFTQAGDELQPLFKQELRQGREPRDPPVSKELASQSLDQLGNRFSIFDVARSQTTCQQFTLIVDGQVQFEAIKPAHTALATPGIGGNHTMRADPFGITYL